MVIHYWLPNVVIFKYIWQLITKCMNSQIIGREEELEILHTLKSSKRSEFLAIYGRRRVGKTYLIRSFFKKNIVFESAGILNGSKSEQFEIFWEEIKKKIPLSKKPKTWLEAFAQLKEVINKNKSTEKKIIFIDEIAWFDNHKSGFLRALDNFWNQYCTKRNDIILVICGSASSWIIDKVIHNKGGLHNRVTTTIHLEPFTIKETKKYLQHLHIKLQEKDILELYMLVGGIPFYLNHIPPGKSIPQIIDHLFLLKNAALKNEFNKLFASLFHNYELHIAIVKALSTKQNGMTRTEIIKKAKLNTGGAVSRAIEELFECDFIIKTEPFNYKKKSSMYRLIDEYSLFYFQFLFNDAKVRGNTMYSSQKFAVWRGYAFENFCFRHESAISTALGIHGIEYQIYSWWHEGNEHFTGAQIDLIFVRADNCINLFEIKYSAVNFTISKQYAKSLETKKENFRAISKTKKNIFFTFLSNLPANKNTHYLSIIDNEIVLDKVFYL
jgi:uncharacterized protein